MNRALAFALCLVFTVVGCGGSSGGGGSSKLLGPLSGTWKGTAESQAFNGFFIITYCHIARR